MTNRQMFLQCVGQTSPEPICLDIVKATGSKLWDRDGREYLDLIGGISVCNVGHCHPAVVKAIKDQAEKYLHVMVYGEFIESPQIQFASKLLTKLPSSLNSVFFTASGSEATEGAMKLSKRYTGRTEIISFKNSYHGSTQGALSLMGSEYWKQAYRPLLPDVRQLEFNVNESIESITEKTACVVAETIQAEAGVIRPSFEWMRALRSKCTETGALLVLDEIQCGFGRNGSLFAFEQFDIVPDILLLGKAIGGGMPLGAFVADRKKMNVLTADPVLGHINTFGGHPVSCAAGLAAFNVLIEENLIENVMTKEALFKKLLVHKEIIKVNTAGLMIAVHLVDDAACRQVIRKLLSKNVFTDWFLFAPEAIRIVPPLNISVEEIDFACKTIIDALDER